VARVDEPAGAAPAGVALIAYRPNISLGGLFASVEELQVRAGLRRRGVGRALLGAVGERCRARGVSYLEVQTDEAAEEFYAACGFEREGDVLVFSRAVLPNGPWDEENLP
jgi:GNAT superfamily N-acetyltransferase